MGRELRALMLSVVMVSTVVTPASANREGWRGAMVKRALGPSATPSAEQMRHREARLL